jgi:hypothetical protein
VKIGNIRSDLLRCQRRKPRDIRARGALGAF